MQKFILHTLKYILFILIVLNVASALSLWVHRKSAYYKPSYLVSQVEQDDFDYIILGSSTGLTTLNSIQIDTITRLSGINLSMDDSSLSSHYLMLSHFLNLGKTTRKVVLSISEGDLENENPKLSGNDYRFLPWISKPYVRTYYASFSGKKAQGLAMSRYLPIWGISQYNSVLFFPSLQAILQPQKRNRFDRYGNYVYPNSGGVNTISEKETHIQINNPFFNKLKALCDDHQIELILYQPPVANKNVLTINTDLEWINHSKLLNDSKLFYDNAHVNAEGRFIASKELAKAFLKI